MLYDVITPCSSATASRSCTPLWCTETLQARARGTSSPSRRKTLPGGGVHLEGVDDQELLGLFDHRQQVEAKGAAILETHSGGKGEAGA